MATGPYGPLAGFPHVFNRLADVNARNELWVNANVYSFPTLVATTNGSKLGMASS